MGHPLVETIIDNVGDPWWLPVSALESPEWRSDEPALLVDYRLELHGLRDSGCLISHLVTRSGVMAPVQVLRPEDPALEVRLPAIPSEQLSTFAESSREAARRDALTRFEEFKAEQAALIEQELERIIRMFDSRKGFLGDRITRNHREVKRLQRFGTEAQKRIIPARRGQIAADEKRLAELEDEQRERANVLQGTLPSHFLRLLAVTLVVRPGRLKEMAL
jgi:hypothetical protein